MWWNELRPKTDFSTQYITNPWGVQNTFFHHCKLRWSKPLFSSRFLSGIIFFFQPLFLPSRCCHTFRRLRAGARGAAAGVSGCGGGAQGPHPQQTSRLPAHAEGGQEPHRTERWRRDGRLRLWWVSEWVREGPQCCEGDAGLRDQLFLFIWMPAAAFLSVQTTAAWHF